MTNRLRIALGTAFPDHCATWLPSQRDDDERERLTSELRFTALNLLRAYDRKLRPLSRLQRLAREAGARLWALNSLLRALIAGFRLNPSAILDCWRVALKYNVSPNAYFKLRLFEPHNRSRIRRYIHEQEMAALIGASVQQLAHAQRHAVNDKLSLFFDCQEAGIPAAPVLAYTRNGEVHQIAPDEDFRRDLIIKVNDLAVGEGVELITWDGTGWEYGGKRLTYADLTQALSIKSTGHDAALLQPRLANHAAIKPLTARGLSTVRVVTISFPGAPPDVAAASMRMSVGESIVDNIGAGGLTAPVDIQSGTLIGPAAGKNILNGWFDRHPDTNAAIHLVLPYWREACALCLRAHERHSAIPTVGWDVAILDDGPVILEGNVWWDSELAQANGYIAYGETKIAEALHRER